MKQMELKSIKALFLDMDGVLWHGKEPIGNLARTFAKIEQAGIIPLFGTNNSTKTPQSYCDLLAHFQVKTKPEQFFTPGTAFIEILRQEYSPDVKTHVFGSPALKELLTNNGIYLTDQEKADIVLVSLDREMTYDKVAAAMIQIMQGAKFYATNTDSTLVTEDGWRPGGGVMVAAVATCAGVSPIVIGKPQTIMHEMAAKRFNLRPDEILVVGDRHETDIMGGINAGCKTALVLSGYETPESIQKLSPTPDIILKDLEALADLFLSGSAE